MNTSNFIDELRVKLVIADHTEQHLKSAENALIEKEEYIKSLQKAYKKTLKIARYYKEATQDLVVVNQSLSDRIVSLVETHHDENAFLKLKIAMLEQENQTLLEEVSLLKNRIKDIKGTINSMCD